MTADCSLNYKFNTWKFQAQTWGEHVVYRNCFWHSEQFLYTTCSPHVLQKEELLIKIYLYSRRQLRWNPRFHNFRRRHLHNYSNYCVINDSWNSFCNQCWNQPDYFWMHHPRLFRSLLRQFSHGGKYEPVPCSVDGSPWSNTFILIWTLPRMVLAFANKVNQEKNYEWF